MATEMLIIDLFCRVDDQTQDLAKHPQAKLYPSEVITLALLFAIKGVGNRAYYDWLLNDWQHLFPNLPHRTRLFRLFLSHQHATIRFLAEKSVLGIIDSYGIELIHPIREGRSPAQIGKKGKSNYRWIVGGKLCLLINQWGLIVDWDCDTANVHDTTFHPLIKQVQSDMVVFADVGFQKVQDNPENLKICPRGTWNERMVVETILSMMTLVWHFKKVMHRVWNYFAMRLAFTMAAFNIMVQWHGFKPDKDGFINLAIAHFRI